MNKSDKFSVPVISERWAGWLLLAAICLWLLISLPSLLSYPTPHGDEALFGSVAYNVMQNGSFGIPIYGNINGVREDFIQNGRFYEVALAAWFRFFGVSLFSARLFSVLGAVATSIFVWLTAKKLMPAQYALIASALCLFAWKTFYASHRVRPDMWLAFTVILILWLYVTHPQHPGWLGFIAGLMLNVHLPAVFGIAAIALVRLSDWATKRIQAASFLKFCAGLVLGISLWATFLLIPNPLRTIMQLQHGIAGTAQGSSLNLAGYSLEARLANAWGNLQEGFLGATRFGWLEVLACVLALIVLLALRSRSQDLSLVLFVIGTIAAMIVSPYLRPYYLIMLMPSLALVIGQAASLLAVAVSPVASFVLVVPLLGAYIAGDAVLAWQSRTVSYQHYSQELKALVPPGLPVFGDGALWFEFYDQPYTTDMYLNYADVQGISRADWLQTILQTQQIQVIIWSDQFAPWSESVEKPVSDVLDKTLHERCNRLGVVEEPFYSIDRGNQPLRRFEVWQCPVLNSPPP